MKDLIERYIEGLYNFMYQEDHPTISHRSLREQVIAFLTDRDNARKNRIRWFRALVAVLTRPAKVDLVAALLREAKDVLAVDYDTLLIDAAMETIYPSTTLHRVKTEVKSDREEDNHYYISFDHTRFAGVMLEWSQEVAGEVNFIDVGCGLGDKLVLACWFVDGIKSVSGVEINNHVYNLGKFFIGNLFGTTRGDWGKPFNEAFQRSNLPVPLAMIEDNAFNIDYKPYNLIYMYQPIANSEKMKNLYLHILETMPVGSLMIEVLPPHVTLEILTRQKNLSVLEDGRYLVVKKIA